MMAWASHMCSDCYGVVVSLRKSTEYMYLDILCVGEVINNNFVRKKGILG
jgi:hypothetical protein